MTKNAKKIKATYNERSLRKKKNKIKLIYMH